MQHPLIEEIRGKGLMLSAIMKRPEIATEVVMRCMNQGLILFFLLFEKRAVRITPPLTISEKEIIEGCEITLNVLEELQKEF